MGKCKRTFWSKVALSHDCWEWSGAINDSGYGVFHDGKKFQYAHRFSYGAIPNGMEVDHLCRNTRCVKPTHLEAVTPRINKIRAKPKVNHGSSSMYRNGCRCIPCKEAKRKENQKYAPVAKSG